jgi:hypothetical protein
MESRLISIAQFAELISRFVRGFGANLGNDVTEPASIGDAARFCTNCL